MSHPPLAFAVPGDITTVTGGYIYDRRLLDGLRCLGHDVEHIELPASFPNPTIADAALTSELLSKVGADRTLIIDGLAYGAIPTAYIARANATLVALVHHPLAKESGLADAQRDYLFQTERDNLALAHHVLVPSPHTAAILTSEYGVPPDKLTIIRPGTDRPVGTPSKVQPPMILSVGIQAPRKGHDVLLKALAQITDILWRAVIVGSEHDAEYARNLTSLRDELGLNSRVDFTGQVSSQTLSDLYQQASIFALATRYEGYGIVFDEAQAHGLPIVSCATGAVPDTVPSETGILVPVDSPELFASALRSLLLDSDRRDKFAKAARQASHSFPDWNDAAKQASDAILKALRKEVWDVG
jgi:glycosyltransferase involved in cell wall biosynthesis